MTYIATIGLEIHAQLLTETKMFCRCRNSYGDVPNTNICPICLGHPGILPVPNMKVIEFALRLGYATNSRIEDKVYFARKNYFYPDLPKGYQITQYADPICSDGYIDIEGNIRIRLKRIHVEEDSGKNFHPEREEDEGLSYIDYNRGGVPLVEIVTEPDLHSADEAYDFLKRLHKLLRFLGVCSGNMEKGELRCDVNVDVAKEGEGHGTIVEIKNMNSFSNVKRAIEYEIDRQIACYEEREKVNKETRTWDERLGETKPLRSKEYAEDYRYFPEPDIPPIVISDELKEHVKISLPELPWELEERLEKDLGLSKENISFLTDDLNNIKFFLKAEKHTPYKQILFNIFSRDYMSILKEKNLEIDNERISPQALADLANNIGNGTIAPSPTGTAVLNEMAETGRKASDIIKDKGLMQISDREELRSLVQQAVNANPKQLKQYLSGKEVLFGFFIGQVMKATGGKANPKLVNELMRVYLDSLKEDKP